MARRRVTTSSPRAKAAASGALALRAKRREIKRTEPVRCIADAAHDALEVGERENEAK